MTRIEWLSVPFPLCPHYFTWSFYVDRVLPPSRYSQLHRSVESHQLDSEGVGRSSIVRASSLNKQGAKLSHCSSYTNSSDIQCYHFFNSERVYLVTMLLFLIFRLPSAIPRPVNSIKASNLNVKARLHPRKGSSKLRFHSVYLAHFHSLSITSSSNDENWRQNFNFPVQATS